MITPRRLVAERLAVLSKACYRTSCHAHRRYRGSSEGTTVRDAMGRTTPRHHHSGPTSSHGVCSPRQLWTSSSNTVMAPVYKPVKVVARLSWRRRRRRSKGVWGVQGTFLSPGRFFRSGGGRPLMMARRVNDSSNMAGTTFRRRAVPSSDISFAKWPNLKTMLRPSLFTLAFVPVSFGLAGIASRDQWVDWNRSFLRPARRIASVIPGLERRLEGRGQLDILTFPLILANVAVFAAWVRARRVGQLDQFLNRWFTAAPYNKRALPMLLSSFSHKTGGHLLFNMIALYSVAPGVVLAAGPENSLAFYLSAAVLSSYGSVMLRFAQRRMTPSLGASGGVLALFGAVAYLYPSTRFSIIFLPMFSFSGTSLVTGVALFDSLGLLGVYRSLGLPLNFDHAAHLIGLGSGVAFTEILRRRKGRGREMIKDSLLVQYQRTVYRAYCSLLGR